jgi:hypothetical protein
MVVVFLRHYGFDFAVDENDRGEYFLEEISGVGFWLPSTVLVTTTEIQLKDLLHCDETAVTREKILH